MQDRPKKLTILVGPEARADSSLDVVARRLEFLLSALNRILIGRWSFLLQVLMLGFLRSQPCSQFLADNGTDVREGERTQGGRLQRILDEGWACRCIWRGRLGHTRQWL